MEIADCDVLQGLQHLLNFLFESTGRQHVEQLLGRVSGESESPMHDDDPADDTGGRVQPIPAKMPPCQKCSDGQDAGEGIG